MNPGQYRWMVNNQVFKRNPDSYQLVPVTPNVMYSIMAIGSQVRTQSRKILSANQLTITWKNADEILRRAVSIFTQTSGLGRVVLVGSKPTLSLWAYLDTLKVESTTDVVDTRPGNAGHRRDLTVTGNTDGPNYHSYYNVPADFIVNPSYVQSSFLGQFGISSYDVIPNWNGKAWNQLLVNNAPLQFSNLGTAEWSPIIKINGPFSALTINIPYENVDGTGAGVSWTWLGNPLGVGDFLLIDTDTMRCFLSQGSSPINYGNGALTFLQYVLPPLNEVYTFSLYAQSTGIPFPYWPPAPMGDFVITPIVISGSTLASSIDYSNNGLETFRYR